jgi:ketosteroid isomerase-like protein
MPSAKPPLANLAALSSAEHTEALFYEALQSGDIERLMGLWSDEEEVSCIHPGGPRVLGLPAVRASFEAMFEQGPVDAHPEQTRRLVHPDCAVHSVLERVAVVTEQGPGSVWVWATNVYVKSAQGWKLVSHHASPGLLGPAPQQRDAGNTLH